MVSASRPRSSTRRVPVLLHSLLVGLRCLLTGTTALVLAAAFLAGASTPAAADPPLTLAQAKAQVDQLEIDAEALDQQALAVKVRLTAGTKALARKQQNVRHQGRLVARLRRQLSQVALADFQQQNLGTTAKLFLTPDAGSLLNRIATVSRFSEHQQSVLRDFQSEQAHLADLERSQQADVARLRASDRELAKLRAASVAKVNQAKALLARLTQRERERIAAQERAAALAARKAAEAAARASAEREEQLRRDKAAESREPSSSPTDSPKESSQKSSADPAAGQDPPPTRAGDKGLVALAFAKQQLGKPYVFGAEGPKSYDCSGLTSSAWRAAGVRIPRTSLVQSVSAGRAVAKADLQPGDLVFFFSPVSHVALYVGNGVVLHAPRPGKSVTYTQMSHMPYAGARRPG